MIELHERLSEFSYGYGVTREIEQLLQGIGLKTVPFLPNLVHEAQVGFDVAFKKPGAVLMVQFKLGQSLERLRGIPQSDVPSLGRPYWRFKLNTAEPEGQYETLLKAEEDGAEVYYVAPRFVDWADYLFENEEVLENSLLIGPSAIRNALIARSATDGPHKILYDRHHTYICSDATEIEETPPAIVGQRIISRAKTEPLEKTIRRIFEGLENRDAVRRISEDEQITDDRKRISSQIAGSRLDRTSNPVGRQRRLRKIRERARSEEDAIAGALGLEAWSLGIQMILVESN